jgi:hypothetical protein
MLRRLGSIGLCLLASLAAAGGASARTPPTAFPVIGVSATTDRGGFTGRLALERFSMGSAGLLAVGHLTGTLKDRRYPSPEPIDLRGFSFPAAVAPVSGAPDCGRLALNLAGRRTKLFGLAATFPPRALVLRPHRGSPRAYRELLCGTAQALAAQAPPSAVVHLPNALLLFA